MSTMILLKDCDKLGKKGETVSVPFVDGKRLLAEKVAVYPARPQYSVSAQVPRDHESDRLRKQNEELVRKLADQQKQIDELLMATSPSVQSFQPKDKK